MLALVYFHKASKRIFHLIYKPFCLGITWYLLRANGVKVGAQFKTNGIPIIDISLGGQMSIGKNFRMNNGKYYNRIGRQQQCNFIVGNKGRVKIGDNVGLSGTTIVCHQEVTIEDNVKIGGNVVIYDTDFHSLDSTIRSNPEIDFKHSKTVPVIIQENVFIGAHTTILKGVTIGENAVIGAGSVVSKSIPSGEIWAGNPCQQLMPKIFKDYL